MSEHSTGTKSEGAEVEVTPEMIEAGVAELAFFNPKEDSFEAAVELIFRAMIENREAEAEGKDA